MSTQPSLNGQVRHQNLYAHHMWLQQRFFAGFLMAAGAGMTVFLFFQHSLFTSGNELWLLYLPSGLVLGGVVLYYRWRSHVRVLEDAVRISTMTSHIDIPYDAIRMVKVQHLRSHFLEGRSRMVVRAMKPLLDQDALFIRLRGSDEEVAAITKRLGNRLANEDTVAIPVPDANAAAWSITSHLPERIGQNLGGKRRKRRR